MPTEADRSSAPPVASPSPRLQLARDAPEAYQAMLAVDASIAASPLDGGIKELVKIRVSQMNGCAFCVDMHTQDARAAGEEERRLNFLAAWREAPVFTERERAALALAEAITDITQGHVPDAVYGQAERSVAQDEIGWLIMAAVAINAFNRMAIVARHPRPGSYNASPDSA